MSSYTRHTVSRKFENSDVTSGLLAGEPAIGSPWRRWQITKPRVLWPVLAFQFALFFSMFGVSAGGSSGGDGSILRQVFWAILFSVSLLGVTASPHHLKQITAVLSTWRWRLAILIVFWFYATASALWGDFPSVTAKRGVLLGMVMVLCVLAAASAVVLRISLAAVVLPPLVALLLVSLAFTAAYPAIAFSPIGWQGMTGQKNTAGQLGAILFLATLFVRAHGGLGNVWVRWTLAGAALVALGASRSATSLVCLLAALMVLVLLVSPKILRRYPSWMIPIVLLGCVLLVGGWLLFLFDALPSSAVLSSWGLDALGKSGTLTGRTKLWDLILEQERYRSTWFGLGYGGFWDSSYQQILYVVQRLGFQPIQAHNGYLDIFNELGVVGLVLALGVAFAGVAGIFRVVLKGDLSPSTLMASALIAFILVSNFSESSLLRSTNQLNLLFLFAMLHGATRSGTNASQRSMLRSRN